MSTILTWAGREAAGSDLVRRDIGNHVSTGQYQAATEARSDKMNDDGIYEAYIEPGEVRSVLQDDDFIYAGEDVGARRA